MITLSIQGQVEPDARTPNSACFNQSEIRIGRGVNCDFVINDKSVSRNHCSILCENGRHFLKDTSMNGVLLNEAAEPVFKNNLVELHNGDVLTLGNVVIRIAIPQRSSTAGTGPAAEAPDCAPDSLLPVGLQRWKEGGSLPLSGSIGSVGAPPVPAGTRETYGATAIRDARTEWRATDTMADTPSPARNPPVRPPATATGRETANGPAATGPARVPAEVRAFLEGAGVPRIPDDARDLVPVFHALGAAYRQAAVGLAQLMLARRKLKDSLEVDLVPGGSGEINPLKLLNVANGLIEALTVATPTGFLAPEKAVAETVADLKAHQMQLAAALPKAFHTILGRIGPEALEKALVDDGIMDALVPSLRKAKLFELYEKRFHEMFGDKPTDAHGYILEALRDALDKDD